MQGRTHVVAGVATALNIMVPKTPEQLVLGTAFAALGSVISDIDIDSSKSTRHIARAAVLFAVILFVLVASEVYYGINILSSLLSDSNRFRVFVGIAVFFGFCLYGKSTPHRSFTHSILCMLLMTGTIYVLSPNYTTYFFIAFLSHILLDLLNMKQVKLFWPLPGGAHIGLCKSDGVVNDLIFLCSMVSLAMLSNRYGEMLRAVFSSFPVSSFLSASFHL